MNFLFNGYSNAIPHSPKSKIRCDVKKYADIKLGSFPNAKYMINVNNIMKKTLWKITL